MNWKKLILWSLPVWLLGGVLIAGVFTAPTYHFEITQEMIDAEMALEDDAEATSGHLHFEADPESTGQHIKQKYENWEWVLNAIEDHQALITTVIVSLMGGGQFAAAKKAHKDKRGPQRT
jgi:hypothetical protein